MPLIAPLNLVILNKLKKKKKDKKIIEKKQFLYFKRYFKGAINGIYKTYIKKMANNKAEKIQNY